MTLVAEDRRGSGEKLLTWYRDGVAISKISVLINRTCINVKLSFVIVIINTINKNEVHF